MGPYPGSRITLLALLGLLLPAAVHAARLPDSFSETQIADGLTGATAMAVAADGRVFLCEQTGTLRVVKDDKLLPEPFVTLTVDSSWERGLIGVALDPHFAENRYVYLNYIVPTPYPHHRISRFTARGDVAEPGSEVILLEGDNQNDLGGEVKNGHQGGHIHFGKDEKLYIAIGDQTAGAPAQDMKTFQGKILRINADGTIPDDNPFLKETSGKYRAIWALGCRNPFSFAVQPGTGRIFINDVGGANEEINEGFAGANYGWPTADHGPTGDPRFHGPLYWYKESSITGGTFYNPPKPQFPPEYVGRYFFNDYKANWIKTLDPDKPQDVKEFATGLTGVVDLQVSPEGELYYLSRNAWVKDQQFKPNTGSLWRVRWTGNKTPPAVVSQPAVQTVLAGSTAYFRVAATGSAPLRYQWQRDGVNVPAATEPTLALPALTQADSGAQFRCLVANAFGEATSKAATLTVRPTDSQEVAARFGGIFVQPEPGAYTGPVLVRLKSETDGTTLRYTTDGSEPSADSPAWQGTLLLRQTTTLKLRPFRNGTPQGKAVTAAWTITGDTPYGLLQREPAAGVKVPPVLENVPPLLSQTGVFADLADLRPAAGVIPYNVKTPLWSDGAAKRRWIALPPGGQIDFAAGGEWTFPSGTVFVKHFDLPANGAEPGRTRRLETRLLVVDGTGNGYGVTYKWRPDERDADLLTEARTEPITIHTAGGTRTQTWYYPSPGDCLTCHTSSAKFVLGVKTRQLNSPCTYPDTGVTDNQLRLWNYLGMFSRPLDEGKIDGLPRLAAPDDRQASVEQRVRSYLDANCAHCHRPGNTVRATFDARYDTPLTEQGLVGAATVSDRLSLNNPRVVVPGEPGRSMLYHRMSRPDHFRMPPLASNVPDEAALALLREWIEGLRSP
jgi:uncharacterized repeat protein (TIGR03806 family)